MLKCDFRIKKENTHYDIATFGYYIPIYTPHPRSFALICIKEGMCCGGIAEQKLVFILLLCESNW